MTQRVFIAGSWDFAAASYGTMTVTDSGGAHAAISFSSGKYEHGKGSGYCTGAGVTTPALSFFGTALQTALNAMGARTYTVTFSNGVYAIAVDSGTFSVAFAGGTGGASLYGLLGCSTGAIGAASSWSSDILPWFWITPAKPGLTNYIMALRVNDAIKEAITDSGTLYRLAPTSIPRLTSWEHHYEPKERVDLDWLNSSSPTSTHLYAWERLWNDYGLAQMPIGLYVEQASGTFEKLAFSLLQPTYDQSVCRRRAPSDDTRFIISVKARLWTTSTANAYARTFNV